MKKTFNTLNIVTTAMLCAVGVIAASALHAFGGREIATLFSPMHLPVFLAGILCGEWLGLICGVMSPLMSFLSTGGARPPVAQLIPMIFELGVYGFLSGLLRKVFLKNPATNKVSSVLALIISMIAGRVVAAFVSAIFLTTTNELSYFVNLGVSMLGKFTTTWAGILVQLMLIPALMFALRRSGVLIKYLPEDIVTVKSAKHTDVQADEQTDGQTTEPPTDEQAQQ